MRSKIGSQTIRQEINPDQLSDHLVPILRAMGFLNGHTNAKVRIIGVEGMVPVEITLNPEKEEEDLKEERWVLLRAHG